MKTRLDVLMVERGLAESREKAKAIIMSGNVFVEGQREDKAGSTFPEEVSIEVRGHTLPYVSRGGFRKNWCVLRCWRQKKRPASWQIRSEEKRERNPR